MRVDLWQRGTRHAAAYRPRSCGSTAVRREGASADKTTATVTLLSWMNPKVQNSYCVETINGSCIQSRRPRNELKTPVYLCGARNLHSPHSNDRSAASSKASSPQSAIQCFLFLYPVSCRFLKFIQYFLTSSSSSPLHFCYSLYLSFNSGF
jgi:hypothetical protein